MEQFQLLDEQLSNLILRFGFLDVEDLPFATAEEYDKAPIDIHTQTHQEQQQQYRLDLCLVDPRRLQSLSQKTPTPAPTLTGRSATAFSQTARSSLTTKPKKAGRTVSFAPAAVSPSYNSRADAGSARPVSGVASALA
ncbi:hypothetical protein COL922a_005268 [Colletotrichum nupharicola]|nr:hypothetical protein COL922a_005268 [Colletotrichum nupharicola]